MKHVSAAHIAVLGLSQVYIKCTVRTLFTGYSTRINWYHKITVIILSPDTSLLDHF